MAKTNPSSSAASQKGKVWLIVGITVLMVVMLSLLAISPVRKALFGKAVMIKEGVSVDCGSTITQSLTLGGDLTGCSGDGLIIGADNLILDCNGHFITGSGRNTGILVLNKNKITIKNCKINNFGDGVFISVGAAGGSNSDIELIGNEIQYNLLRGVGIYKTAQIVFKNNLIAFNLANGGKDFECKDSVINPGIGNSYSPSGDRFLIERETCRGWDDNYGLDVSPRFKIDHCKIPRIIPGIDGDAYDDVVTDSWKSGGTYYLTKDISPDSSIDPANCIRFNKVQWEAARQWHSNSFGVTLDCQGYKIIGNNNQGIGIDLEGGNSKITIKNCDISGFDTGIKLSNDINPAGEVKNRGATENKLINNKLNGNNFGIKFQGMTTVNNLLESNFVSCDKLNTYIDLRCESDGAVASLRQTGSKNYLSKGNEGCEGIEFLAECPKAATTILPTLQVTSTRVIGTYVPSQPAAPPSTTQPVLTTSDLIRTRSVGTCTAGTCNADGTQRCVNGVWTACSTGQSCQSATGTCGTSASGATSCENQLTIKTTEANTLTAENTRLKNSLSSLRGKWGDLDCDGKIDLNDAIHLARVKLGIIVKEIVSCDLQRKEAASEGTISR